MDESDYLGSSRAKTNNLYLETHIESSRKKVNFAPTFFIYPKR